jgi:hypothetical protein
MMILACCHLVAAALRRRPLRPRAPPDARARERSLHGAADHADLKHLIETQAHGTSAPWWPGSKP